MIGLFCVDVPNVLFVRASVAEVAYGLHGCEHGVVHVVVAVLPVAPDAEKVGYAVEPPGHFRQFCIAAMVGGIGFPLPDDGGVLHVRHAARNAGPPQFLLCHRDEILVGKPP